MLLQTEALPHP